jgi:hypothetical protein
MKISIISGICIVGFVFMLSSCAHDQTKSVARKLDPSDLYPIYKTNVIDLKSRSKCPSPPSVKLVNTETRNEDLLMVADAGHTHTINPKELTNHIVDYISDAFEKCQVKVDGSSTKVIEVSINHFGVLLNLFGAQGANINLWINIPETQYTKIYTAQEWSGASVWTIMAYAIHMATWRIIDDPVIQNYVLCR